jgi:hypothetical protein
MNMTDTMTKTHLLAILNYLEKTISTKERHEQMHCFMCCEVFQNDMRDTGSLDLFEPYSQNKRNK